MRCAGCCLLFRTEVELSLRCQRQACPRTNSRGRAPMWRDVRRNLLKTPPKRHDVPPVGSLAARLDGLARVILLDKDASITRIFVSKCAARNLVIKREGLPRSFGNRVSSEKLCWSETCCTSYCGASRQPREGRKPATCATYSPKVVASSSPPPPMSF